MLDLYHMGSAMERSRRWMSTRRKLAGGPDQRIPGITGTVAALHDSWDEETAFAKDSAGGLEGCVWPPRSYLCSFCRREFRSAQALGGHMNVHRWDRARLKLSPPVAHVEDSRQCSHQQRLIYNPSTCSPMASSYSSGQVCALVYSNTTPINPGTHISGFVPSTSRLSPSRVLTAVSPPDNPSCEQPLIPPSFSATFLQENLKPFLLTTPLPLSDSLSLSILTVPEGKLGKSKLRFKEVKHCRDERFGVEVEEADPVNKRRRLDVAANIPLSDLLGSAPRDSANVLQSGAPGFIPSDSMLELDLELRLGSDPSKIK